MTIHILDEEKHSDFLSQERIDPITGDILEGGDKIVICASCKSAFFADSWTYMNGKHCNQTHTLREIPKQEAVKIDRESRNERLDKLAFFQFRTVRQSEVTGIYTGFFALIGGLMSLSTFLFSMNSIIFSAVPVLIGIGIGKKMYKQKTLFLNSGYFIIDKDKRNQIVISIQEVKSIKVEKAKLFSRLANLFSEGDDYYDLIITTKTGEIYEVFISENEVERIKEETNILKRYSLLSDSENSAQSVSLFNDSNDRNDRIDMGSPF